MLKEWDNLLNTLVATDMVHYSYNKREEDFESLEEYNDYLEQVEIISMFLYV